MSRRLISRIDPWSVARTIFPLTWLLGYLGVMLIYLFAGSLLMNVANEYYDVPDGAGQIGLAGALIASLFTGLIYAIFATLFAVIGAFFYNFLAQLGGGIAVDLQTDDVPLVGEGPEVRDEMDQGIEIIPQAVPVTGTVQETEESPPESEDAGESER